MNPERKNTMTVLLIILSVLLWIASIVTLWRRPLLSPALSYIALVLLSMARGADGVALLPINNTILIGWLCMTVVVMGATIMQPTRLTSSGRGTTYMLVGGLAGLAVGLVPSSFGAEVAMLYSSMVIGTAAGIFFGYLIYSRGEGKNSETPGESGYFAPLLAKGFPTAITLMQMGVPLVILVMRYARQ